MYCICFTNVYRDFVASVRKGALFLFGVFSNSWEVCNTSFFWNIFEYKTLVSTSQTNTKTSLPHFSLRKLGDCHLSHKSPRVGLFMDGMLTEKESNHRQLTNLIQFGLIKNPSLCGD